MPEMRTKQWIAGRNSFKDCEFKFVRFELTGTHHDWVYVCLTKCEHRRRFIGLQPQLDLDIGQHNTLRCARQLPISTIWFRLSHARAYESSETFLSGCGLAFLALQSNDLG